MCSNNNARGGSYGELQLHEDDDEYSGSCRKKQKKSEKVRRRGPGVAELEKIRLQEEHKSPLSSSPSLLLQNMDHHHHTLFAPSSYDLVMSPPKFALPEKLPSLPVFPLSYGSLVPPAPVFQRKQQHSLTMNLPNPPLGQGSFYQFIEPPSNQINSVSQFLEEQNKKMVNAKKKRPWHFLSDITEPSVGPTTTTILRDAIQNRSLGISPVQDSGTTISNPIAIDSPNSSIPSFPRHYPRFIPLGLQYEQQQQQQKDFDDKDMQWRSNKLYSFIPSGDRSNADRKRQPCDQYDESAADHGIDLSLKL
ncbi:PREDICTED: protein SPEAR2-like [Camelina sativa]|uniref:Protein SPEAR2-like n=1 Tax=Camelina sativa TaxID=90675 RepID=A0ABM0WD72_CAMSA|nr:PREDICTED: protein SPEAR2-like [Camelina sativa]